MREWLETESETMPPKPLRVFLVFSLICFILFSTTSCKRLRKIFRPQKKQEQSQKLETQPADPIPAPTAESSPFPKGLSPESMGGAESAPVLAPPSFGASPAASPSAETQATAETNPVALPEIAGAITVFAGVEKKVAEGSLFVVEDAQASSGSGRPLTYHWSLTEGPSDKIQIVEGNSLKGVFKILDLDQVTSFLVTLTVQDGSSQASSPLRVWGFPGKLSAKKELGGLTRKMENVGETLLIARGRSLELYDFSLKLLGRENFESPVLNLVVLPVSERRQVYVFTENGEWYLFDLSDLNSLKKSLLQKVQPSYTQFQVDRQSPEALAVGLQGSDLKIISLQDPSRPIVRNSVSVSGIRNLLLVGKTIYVSDQNSLSTYDASNGVLVAKIPAGGFIRSLQKISNANKVFLMMGLGEDPAVSNASTLTNYGLRIFEIGLAGRLMNEKRYNLKGNLPVREIKSLPGNTDVLIALGKEETSFRIFNWVSGSETVLELPPSFKIGSLFDLWVGKPANIPSTAPSASMPESVAKGKTKPPPAQSAGWLGLSSSDSWKILKLFNQGAGKYKAELIRSSPSLWAAGAVNLNTAGNVLLSDFGSAKNPTVAALLELNPEDLSVLANFTPADKIYFPDFVSAAPGFNFALALGDASSAETQRTESAPASQSGLQFFSRDEGGIKVSPLTSEMLGENRMGNVSKPLGLDAYFSADQRLLAVAVGKYSGMGARSGLYLFKFPLDLSAPALPKFDLSQKKVYIPLADARDVSISPNGKWALVAGGNEGLFLIDLEKNQIANKLSSTPPTFVDRVHWGHDLEKVFVAVLAEDLCALQDYYFKDGKLAFWGQAQGLHAAEFPYGKRCGDFALSADDIYAFVASGKEGVVVLNMSDMASPVSIVNNPTYGMAVGIAVGEKYKNIYIADLVNGLQLAEFGF